MATYPASTSIKFNNFKGIRTRNGIATNGVISATVCQNIDFSASSYDATVNISTSLGNIKIAELQDTYSDYQIIKGFEFESEGVKHLLLYCINDTYGILLEYDIEDELFSEILNTTYNIAPIPKANGITMIDNAYNTFVFTNGVDYYAYCPDGGTVIQKLTPEYDGVPITGLAMCEQDGSLVIGGDNGIVLASAKGDITDFDYTQTESATKPWYQIFGKPITAIVPYIDALLVFTPEDSTVLSGNFSNPTTSGAKREDASLGGCMSFESWVKHDKYIFFYDDTQKNIYYYMQNDYGQKVLGEPLAPEVQKFFNNVNKLQMMSYIGNNKSEIWVLADNFKLIYDYFVNEWSERNCQDITSYFVYDNKVYSTADNKLLKEKAGNIGIYDEVFYPSKYEMQIINLGSFSNMKEMEFQPLLSVTSDYNNTFYLDCQIDGKKVKSKYIKMYFQGAIWGDDSEEYTENELWADDEGTVGQTFPTEDDRIIQQVKGKFISNWYYLKFTLRTENPSDDFSITCFELKGITQETDTTGRK